jgi:NNP family nitrate/nitrite transporter-like MFS transporter
MLAVAALAGVGGGNFASSMTNISWFFPEREKGWALGLNAAGGNIGVAVVQAPFVVSAVITAGAGIHLGRAGLMWVPLALLAAFCAWRFMDNLTVARTDFASSATAARRPHTWVMSFLYIGTFGSFIGYAAAFPLLIKGQFPEVDVTAFAFLGALVGSLSRPFGGRLSDRVGGARVTAAGFLVMGLGVLGVVWALSLHSFALFLAFFMLLFLATGIGNGSTYRMIPLIWQKQARDVTAAGTEERAAALGRATKESSAVIGIAGAIGALGGFLIPMTFGAPWIDSPVDAVQTAFAVFTGFYVVCLAATWFFYTRTAFLAARLPSLAGAGI